jgi:ribose transport system substrate-binding protein
MFVSMSLAIGLAVSTGAQAADKKILAFVTNGSSDFWKAAQAGVKKAQAELPDYDLQFKFTDPATAATQIQEMNDLISAGAAGIMVSAVDPKTETDALAKVASQTLLLTTDSDATQSNRVAYIGSSNVLAGNQVGEILKKAMPNGGKCMAYVGLPGADNAKERLQGINDVIKDTGITITPGRSATSRTL